MSGDASNDGFRTEIRDRKLANMMAQEQIKACIFAANILPQRYRGAAQWLRMMAIELGAPVDVVGAKLAESATVSSDALSALSPIVFRDDAERAYWDDLTIKLVGKGDVSPQSVTRMADEMVEERRSRT